MAGKFVLRSEQDTENPTLPRFYGDGVTAGRTVFYLENAQGNRTAFIALIAQGARFPSDTGCARVRRVYYAGFEIPEFDAGGARNWRFHKGTHTPHPAWKQITAVDHTTDTFTVPNHDYANDAPLALYKRGKDAVSKLPAPAAKHTKYFVSDATANTFKLKTSVGGDYLELTDNGTGNAMFCYRADKGLFDANQGRPDFFPALDFTFSGKSYLEILLPAELSNGEDEPTKLKIIPRGKEVYDFVIDTDGYLSPIGQPLDSENNALVAFDMLRYDAARLRDRFHASSWIDWRDKADQTIPWVGGNDIPSRPQSFPVLSNAAYSSETGVLLATSANAHAFSAAVSERDASAEAIYQGGANDASLIFTTAQTPSAQAHGVIIQPSGTMYFTNGFQVSIIGSASPSDRIKVAYEASYFKVYKNGVQVPLDGITVLPQPSGNFYIGFYLGASGMTLADILLQPSGTSTAPRQVKRYTGDYVAVQQTAVVEAFEQLLHQSPGCSWQDVDGQIRIITTPARTPVMTFYYNPLQDAIKSNTYRVYLKRRPVDESPNYWRYSFRRKDSPILERAYTFIDRPEKRASYGGKLLDAGLIQYGVMTDSLMERIGETRARLLDLDIGFEVEAFLDSVKVAKGDYVYIVDPTGDYQDGNPAKAMVLREVFNFSGDVETRAFDLQIITDDFYSDTAHGRVFAPVNPRLDNLYLPPPSVEQITLSESHRRLNDGTYLPVIDGTARFAPSPNQRGRVFWKQLSGGGIPLIVNHTFDVFAYSEPSFAFQEGDAVSIVAETVGGALPAAFDWERRYYVVEHYAPNKSFRLSDAVGGAPVSFSDNGSGTIKLYGYGEWREQNALIEPNPTTREAVFELAGAVKGKHFVRIQPITRAGVGGFFRTQTTAQIFISGDVQAPLPPPNVRYTWDGVNIRWDWDASPSPNVAGYIVRDENAAVIFQGQATNFVMPARSGSFAVKVYAYSTSSVLSQAYTEAVFVLPPEMDWVNITGAQTLANGTLKKTASTGWGNCGAAFSWSLLTNKIGGRLSYTADTDNQYKVFGFSRNQQINSFDDFDFAVYLQNNGTVMALWNDGGVQQTFIGTYQTGDKFAVEYLPMTADGGGFVRIKKARLEGGQTVYDDIFIFDELPLKFPAYAGIALYTQDSVFAPNLEITGIVCSTLGIRPTAQNQVGTSYNQTTGTLTDTSGAGSRGASFTERIEAGQCGGFFFKPNEAATVFVGLNTSDPNQSADMPIALRFFDDYSVNVYLGTTLAANLGFRNGTEIWALTREGDIPSIRKDGQLVYRWTAAPSAMKNDAILLDAVFAGSSGDFVSDIRLRECAETVRNKATSLPEAVTVTFEKGTVGKNAVFDIPPFNVNDSQTGEVLMFDGTAYVNQVLGNIGVSVGAAVNGGNADQILFGDALTQVAQSPRLVFDGNDLKLLNTTPSTAGTQTQNSPALYLQGTKWRTDLSVSEDVKLRMRVVPINNQYPQCNTPKFVMESWANSAWQEFFSIGTLTNDYLTARYRFANPFVSDWGAMLDVSYDGGYQFKRLNGNPAPLAFTTAGASPSAFPNFCSPPGQYGAELRPFLGGKILFTGGYPGWEGSFADGANAYGTEYVQSNLPIGVGVSGAPTAKLHVISTSEQFRRGYSTIVYVKETTDGNGLRETDIIGASPVNLWKDKGQFEKELETQAGASALYVRVGGVLKKFFTDQQVVGLSETDAYVFTVPANTLSVNGDELEYEFVGQFAGNTNLKAVRVYFGAVIVFSTDDITDSNIWHLKGSILRESVTVARITNQFKATPSDLQEYARATSNFNFANAADLKLVLYAETANTDNIARKGVIRFSPNSSN